MASPLPKFQYWNGTTWVNALTHANNSAVSVVSITKTLNNPATAEVTLSNRSKDPSATGNDARGPFSDHAGGKATIFREFQDCRIIDNETGLILFRGRIYHIRNQYDMQLGSTVKLVLKDMLQELVDIPIDDAPPALRKIDVSVYNTRSKVIARIINQLSTNFDTTDTTKYEASQYLFSEAEQVVSGRGSLYDVISGQQQALAIINDLGKQDPHDGLADSEHFGYDYYVDANAVSSVLTTGGGDVSLNYFKRGSRPSATPNTHGLTLEYPAAGWGGQNNFRKAMMTDAQFTNPNGAFFTSVVAHFEDKGEEGKEKTQHGVGTFELLEGTVIGDFPWEGPIRIQYIDDADIVDGNTTKRNATTGQSLETDNPRFLFVETEYAAAESPTGSSILPCATVHFQSGASSDTTEGNFKFLIISNVYKEETTWIDPQGNSVIFRAFPANPTGANRIRLHMAKSEGHDDTTYPYIDIYKDARASDKHNINKPKRVQIRVLENYESIRKSIAAVLDRSSKTTVTIGKVRVNRYPYTKVIAAHALVARGSGNSVLTFSTNAFTNSGGTGVTDPRLFGARKGMVVAQLSKKNGSDSGITRYAYISAITGTSVTYGSSQTDTSDGTALDTEYDMAILIPTEPGHMVRLKNNLYGVDYDVIIQKIEYFYGTGLLSTQLEGVGINNNSIGVPIIPTEMVNIPIVGASSDVALENIPPSRQAWKIDDGILSVPSGDPNHVKLTSTTGGKSVTLTTLTNNQVHKVDVADPDANVTGYTYPLLEIGATGGDFGHANTSAEVHIIFYRTGLTETLYNSTKLQAIAVKRTSGSGGKIYSEIQSTDDVIIATAQKDIVGGQCILDISPFGLLAGSGWPMDITGIGNNRMTNALLKKGAQPFTTNLEFSGYPATSSGDDSVYNKFRWQGSALQANGTPTTANAGRISFGDSTVADDDITILDGHSDANFTSLGGENYSSGLAASTTYYAFLTIPTSGNASVGVTNDWKVPFQDDKVLLATIVTAPAAPNNANSKGASPTILPIAGKQPTISAVAMSANTILADHITAGSITADKLEAELLIANKFVTLANVGESGGPAGIKISATGIEGFSGGTTKEFYLLPGDGKAYFGGGNIIADSSGLSITTSSTGYGNEKLSFKNSGGITEGFISVATGSFRVATKDGSDLLLGLPAGGQAQQALTDTMLFSCKDFRFNHGTAVSGARYNWPVNSPADDKVLAVQGTVSDVVLLEWADAGSGSGAVSAVANGADNRIATFSSSDALNGESNLTWDGDVLTIGSNSRIHFSSAIGTGVVPTSEYGMFRYAVDGGGGVDDVLAFSSAQSSNAPNAAGTASPDGSAFWIMQSETNHLIFEPCVEYSGDTNNAWIGYHNELAGIRSYYVRAGNGTAATPSYSFISETNSGFYRESQYVLALVANGQSQTAFDGNSGRLGLRLDAHDSTSGPDSSDYPAVFYQGNRDTGFNYYTSATGGVTYTGTQFFSDGVRIAVIGYASSSWRTYLNGGLLVSGASHVSGTFTATTKTFRIPHPLDEANKTLIHGVIEAPRYDLIYRGTATLSSGTVTASIDSASSMTSGTFVALTKNSEIWVQNKTGWTAVRGQVDGGNVIITAQDSSSTDTVAWLVMAERDDTFVKSENEIWTDNIGTFIPEWDISSLDI